MSTPTVQCPNCFARQPAGPSGAVVCGSCEREFTPDTTEPPQKAPAMPVAKAAPIGGAAAPQPSDIPIARPAPSSRPRRYRADDKDDRPRSRRRRYDDDDTDDPPRKSSNPTLLVILIGGGATALVVVGMVVAVALVLFANNPSAKITGPVYVPPPEPMQVAPGPKPAEWPRPNEGFRGGPPPDGPPQKPAERPAPKPRVACTNSNALVIKHQDTLKLTASSEWNGWPVRHLMDGNEDTSWYSNTPDTTITARNNPTITLTFAEDVKVTRVTVLGNRDPAFPRGYTVSEGVVELLDETGKVLSKYALKGVGAKSDFDLTLTQPTTARAVRFTMTKSEQGHCGLSELLVE